jgi:hypothetical protein
LFRRFPDVKERVFLKECKIVSETQCDLGLNALRLIDVLDLMENDYPEKYDEFSDHLEEKRNKALVVARIKHNNQIKEAYNKANDEHSDSACSGQDPSKRMKDLIKRAMKSVASYNQLLVKEKTEERSTCFDLQTMVR